MAAIKTMMMIIILKLVIKAVITNKKIIKLIKK